MSEDDELRRNGNISRDPARAEYLKIMKEKAKKRGETFVENPNATGGWRFMSREQKDKHKNRIANIQKVREERIRQEAEKRLLEKKQREQKLKEEKKLNFQANIFLIFIVLFFLFILSQCSSSGGTGSSCYSTPHGVFCD